MKSTRILQQRILHAERLAGGGGSRCTRGLLRSREQTGLAAFWQMRRDGASCAHGISAIKEKV